MTHVMLLVSMLMIGQFAAGCTTHTHEREDRPPAVIHQDVTPPSSDAREAAREGAREGVRDMTR